MVKHAISDSQDVSATSATADASSDVATVVAAMAEHHADRSVFFERLARHLCQTFRAALVVVELPDRSEAERVIGEPGASERVEPGAVDALLQTATPMPIACDIPVLASDYSASNSRVQLARGLRVELTPAPHRTAMVLFYSMQTEVSPREQIRDLELLDRYTREVREVLAGDVSNVVTELSVAETPAPLGRDSLRLFHLDLDLDGVAFRIANETRRLTRCDRVTVLVERHGRHTVRAISGVSVVDSRSNSVRAAETLVQSAVVLSRPLRLPCDDDLPPQLEAPLDDYWDQTGVTSALVVPLRAPPRDESDAVEEAYESDPLQSEGPILGVLVLEYFSDQAPALVSPAVAAVSAEAALALGNAVEHRQIFGHAIGKRLGGLWHRRRRPWLAAALLLVTALSAAAILIPVEHHVVAGGTLLPESNRRVFAAVDGIVTRVHVADGESVKAGQPLLELENAELDRRAESLLGEIQTARQRLASIRALRLSGVSEPGRASRLALEQRQLESELSNLASQQQVVAAQQAELTVTSPIDGTVVGWQLAQRLARRPVSRGERLLSVVDPAGPWSLKLRIPDREAGPILKALQSQPAETTLPVRFAVATEPESSFAATLAQVGSTARLDEHGNHVIDARAAVIEGDRADPSLNDHQGLSPFRRDQVRVGADVTARIACGRRMLLRSWFSDLFDFAHRNILFYFR